MPTENACYVCGAVEYHDRAGYGFIVDECDQCQRPVCENHADTDASWEGEEDGYQRTSYTCKVRCKEIPV